MHGLGRGLSKWDKVGAEDIKSKELSWLEGRTTE